MIKTILEKWDEIKQKSKINKESIIAQYFFIGNSNIKIYLGVVDDKENIFLEFTNKNILDLDIPKIKGMTINIEKESRIKKDQNFILIKDDSHSENIFEAFSSSLIDQLEFVNNYYDMYNSLIKVVKEYKNYFSNSNIVLTKNEEQGLCAELLELTKLISLKGETVIKNWQGPSKNKRDFVFENSSLEIKSTLKQEDKTVRINSENQLDFSYPSNMNNLFLKVYILEDTIDGININTCINNILNSINEISIKNIFIANLLKLKIDPKVYKSKYNFSIQKELIYKIVEGFPCITSREISNSIYDVSYILKLNNLNNYLINEDDMNELL